MKLGSVKERLEDINAWERDDVRAVQQELPPEPDPSTPEWVNWSVKKKMLEDAIKRMKDRQQLSDKPGMPV
jgi:hypothetical protein